MPSEQSLLKALATVRVATVAQLARIEIKQNLAPETTLRTVRKSLKRLVAFGLVRQFPNTANERRIGPPGYVFTLTSLGSRRANRTTAFDTRQRLAWRPKQATLAHWLAITELYADLRAVTLADDLTIREFQAEGDAQRHYRDSYGRKQVLRPDALVRLAVGDRLLSWFVEVDRDTESPRRIADKCRRYRAYELTDLEYRQYGVFPGVVFVVPTEHRAQAIRQVIAAQPADARGLFWVAVKDEAVQTLIRPKIP